MIEGKDGKTLGFINMTDFLKGQASKIITSLAKENETGGVIKKWETVSSHNLL